MKLKNKLFIIPMCISLLSGCNNIDLKYYKSEDSSTSASPNPAPSEPENKIEDFINKTGTTYTDNITSTSLQTLYETCKKATVTIEIYVTKKQGLTPQTLLYSTGSGFIAKESENNLYIYTNSHVITVEDTSIQTMEIEVIFSDHTRYKAEKVANNSDEDVGIIKMIKPSENNYLIASLGNSSTINPGEAVFAIGSPLGLDYASSITAGIISGVNVAASENDNSLTMYLLQTDTPINPGNSGGPLFNLNGEVIGVNTLKITESKSGVAVEGMGFAIPIDHFNMVANTIITGNTYSRPLLGIQVASISNLSLNTRQEYGIAIQNGLYIVEVENQNSPLVKNTIITHINNKKVDSFSSFSIELYKHKTGDTISITYCNVDGSNSTTLNLTL